MYLEAGEIIVFDSNIFPRKFDYFIFAVDSNSTLPCYRLPGVFLSFFTRVKRVERGLPPAVFLIIFIDVLYNHLLTSVMVSTDIFLSTY